MTAYDPKQHLVEAEFPQESKLIYLNHAAVSPWPLRTQVAINRFAEENLRVGAAHYPQWTQQEDLLRTQFCRLINANSTDDIALQKSTSEGLSAIAYGLEWQPGDEVVISNQEFPSNRIVWESLANKGVTVKVADISGDRPEQALINCCTQHTKLLSVSSVQYATGLRLNLAAIGEHCRQQDILFCVDAIQSLGIVEFDCQAIKADYVVADGHKWMLGPEGLALFYSTAKAREKLQLQQFGWHMVDALGDYSKDSWEETKTARRFECGSPNMLGSHALSASLSLLLELGIDRVNTLLMQKTQRLIAGLSNIAGIRILSPIADNRRSGIVTFTSDKMAPKELYSTLMQEQIICAHRGGGVRFSPHFYTPNDKIDKAVARIESLLSQ